MRQQSSVSDNTKSDPTRRDLLSRLAWLLLVASLCVNVVALVRFWFTWESTPLFADGNSDVLVAAPTSTSTVAPAATVTTEVATPPAPTATQVPTSSSTPTVPRVGLIAGHWKSDSGAICEEDGLQEVEVTLSIARETAKQLRERGIIVDVLPEYAPELYAYEADALISIHADSCLDFEGTTGFKVARASASAIPEIEDRLVDCLYTEYELATELPRHDTSVTHDMRRYHAFYKIDPKTPAVIIEVGFLFNDRDILTEEPERIAAGIATGVRCFLASDQSAN